MAGIKFQFKEDETVLTYYQGTGKGRVISRVAKVKGRSRDALLTEVEAALAVMRATPQTLRMLSDDN